MLDLRQRGLLAVQIYDYTTIHESMLSQEYAIQSDLFDSLSKISSENTASSLIKKELKNSKSRRQNADDSYWHKIGWFRRECTKQEWDEAVSVANDISMKYNHLEINPFETLENIHRENSVFTAEQKHAYEAFV